MKHLLFIICIFFCFKNLFAENNLQFFIKSALENNLNLNAERKKSRGY